MISLKEKMFLWERIFKISYRFLFTCGTKKQQMETQGHASYKMTCLSGQLMEDYLHDMSITQEYARINREAMIDFIVRGMKWKINDSILSTDCVLIVSFDFSFKHLV